MQAHAKVPHISDEETVDFRDLPWYREAKADMTPGLALRIHRESHGWSKAKLGKLLGGVNRRDVRALEKGRRPVSLSIARRASEVFGIPLYSILEPNRIPEQDSGEVTSREGPSVNSSSAVAPRSLRQPRAEAPARADTGVNRGAGGRRVR